MKDGKDQGFYSPSGIYIKRLAGAFSLKSRIPVRSDVFFPRSGVKVSVEDAAILEMLMYGPFDAAGVPIGSRVVKIDGKPVNPNQAIDQLSEMEFGSHSVEFVPPGEAGSISKQIFLVADPPLLNK
jgi:hypothetical protein